MTATKQSPYKEVLSNFLDSTSSHGLPRIGSERSTGRKIFWAVVFLAALAYFLYQLSGLIDTFSQYPVTVNTRIEDRGVVDFPAVTVCNMNMLRKSFVKNNERYKALSTIENKYLGIEDAGKTKKKRSVVLRKNIKRANKSTKRETKSTKRETKSTKRETKSTKIETKSTKRETKSTKRETKSTKRVHNKRKKRADEYDDAYPDQEYPAEEYPAEEYPDEEYPDEEYPDEEYPNEEYPDEEYPDEEYPDEEYPDEEYNSDYDYPEDSDNLFEPDFFDVKDDYDFEGFLRESKTSDLSDLVDILRPSPDDLTKLGEVKDDFIVTCSFDKRNCSDSDFQTIQNSYYGHCFTFNSGMNGNVNRTSKYGSRYGLRLILNVRSFDYIGFFTPDQGVRVSVHPQNITPFPQDEGISAGPGRKTSIGAKLQVILRQEDPYKSNCTTGEGRHMSYDGNYTSLACSLTCLEDKIFDNCGCRERLTMGSNDSFCSFTNQAEAECRARVFAAYSRGALGCDCPMACLEEKYLTSVSSSKWPTLSFIAMMRDLRDIKAIDDMPTDQDGYVLSDTINENLVHLQVYIEDKSLFTIEEIPSYEWGRLVADMGGLLGLFVGISVCTGIEFLELLVDLILVTIKRKPENKPAVQPETEKPV